MTKSWIEMKTWVAIIAFCDDFAVCLVQFGDTKTMVGCGRGLVHCCRCQYYLQT